jgi:3-hydroxyacyl-[acyl-carrier-protein] dehydratase
MISPLPHRAPFMLVDAILDHVPGQRASARRLVSTGDPLLRDERQLSEVFLVEAMAQCAGIASADEAGSSGMLVAVDKFQVHSPVEAGDLLLLEARVVKRMGAMVKARATVRIGEQLCAECDLVLRLETAPGQSR